MKQREYEEKVRDDIYRFLVKPLIVLIGIYIVSSFIDTALKLNSETFRYVFTGIGGIPFIIYYYRKELKK